MKPIERGALVLVTVPNTPQSGVVGQPRPDRGNPCRNCNGYRRWELLEDLDHWYCECVLIRIDDDPDAINEPVEQEQTA